MLVGIREKRPGYFEVRVCGGVDPATGKARQLSRTVHGSVKDANALRAQLLIEVERKGGGGSTHTLAELFEAVIDHLEALGREPTRLIGYQQIAARFESRLGKMPLRKLRASHLDAFYGELAARRVITGAGAAVPRLRASLSGSGRALGVGRRQRRRPGVAAARASPPTRRPHGGRRRGAARGGRAEPSARARRRLPAAGRTRCPGCSRFLNSTTRRWCSPACRVAN